MPGEKVQMLQERYTVLYQLEYIIYSKCSIPKDKYKMCGCIGKPVGLAEIVLIKFVNNISVMK